MELDNLREQARSEVCRARMIQRLAESQDFADAVEAAGTPPTMVDPVRLKKWIRQTIYTDLEEMTYNELRALAQAKAISYYSRMNKLELIGALNAAGVVPTRKPVKRDAPASR